MTTISCDLHQLHRSIEKQRKELKSYERKYDTIVADATTKSVSIATIQDIIEQGKDYRSQTILPARANLKELESEWQAAVLEIHTQIGPNKPIEESEIKKGFAAFLDKPDRQTQKARLFTLLNPHQALAEKAHAVAQNSLRNSFTKYLSTEQRPNDWTREDWDTCLLSSYCNEEYGNAILVSEGLPTIENFLPKLSEDLKVRWAKEFPQTNY